ncbi:MAG: type II secretion system protein, partial [Planctomycetota bacterium]
MDRRRRAFTLVELLVVVAIIALLVTILMPSLGRALELTRRTICQTNLHSLGVAWQIYFQDNEHKIPKMFGVRDSQWDFMAQFDFLIWSQNGGPDWISSGVLYGQKLIGSEDNYVCPTIRRNSGGRWFTNLTDENGSYHNDYTNPWPVARRLRHTTTTYGRRRTN